MPHNSNESDESKANEPGTAKVRATLTLSDGAVHAATVLELSQGKLVLEIDGAPNLAAAIGDPVRVALTGEDLSTPLLVGANVSLRSTRPDSTVLQLTATDPLSFQRTPTLRRRQGVRVAPRPETQSVAQLRAEGEVDRITARVLDVSRSGLRVELALLDEGLIADCKHVHVQLTIANEPEPLRFVAEIRSRTLQGDKVQCGLQILHDRTEDHDEIDRRLGRFVMARQVEGVLERRRPKAS